MDGISRSRGWDKEILHGVLPMEQLVLSDKWARILYPSSEGFFIIRIHIVCGKAISKCLILILVGFRVSLSAQTHLRIEKGPDSYKT